MSDTLIENIPSKGGDSKNSKRIMYCAVCDARLPPNAIFCLECDPPLPPGEEPEECGISFEQALLRITVLVILFIGMAFGMFGISSDRPLLENQMKVKSGTIAENEKPRDKDLQTVHMVTVNLANIRSEPSIDGKVQVIVEQGTRLEVIESKEYWSKVNVLEKTGWISNKLFKSEILAPE